MLLVRFLLSSQKLILTLAASISSSSWQESTEQTQTRVMKLMPVMNYIVATIQCRKAKHRQKMLICSTRSRLFSNLN